ncbi:hypothetical protein H072_6601 [Dactylellina haptotyla CBS 200.50]|uniref:Glycosyltransferase 61 catalytic domain-containing protein n=1 Tax=Dactylellina haptotyla (strain CBS 200.50) TaxID=1284197 RepID=S8A9B4_DACHA|nr:hypothetical protein H072_6601 [Dactylellina haptotyla CBS 200.50]
MSIVLAIYCMIWVVPLRTTLQPLEAYPSIHRIGDQIFGHDTANDQQKLPWETATAQPGQDVSMDNFQPARPPLPPKHDEPHSEKPASDCPSGNETASEYNRGTLMSNFRLSADYINTLQGADIGKEKEWCDLHFGLPYLENMASNVVQYCTPDSRSQIDCMHATLDPNKTRHSTEQFCVVFNTAWHEGKFYIDCKLRAQHELDGFPPFINFTKSKLPYRNSAGEILEDWAILDDNIAAAGYEASGCSTHDTPFEEDYRVIYKRDSKTVGVENLWCTLTEISSWFVTMDVLQMATNKRTGKPYMSTEDAAKLETITIDGTTAERFDDIYSYFSGKPVRPLSDWNVDGKNGTKCLQKAIIPLIGRSGTWWDLPDRKLNCDHSVLAETIRNRFLKHFQIPTARNYGSTLNMTFIDRGSTPRRKIQNMAEVTDLIRKSYPNITLTVVDMNLTAWRDQLDIITHTDILVGVHGAGHAHSFFLPPQSAVIELLPGHSFNRRNYRNLAKMRGMRYFSGHITQLGDGEWRMCEWVKVTDKDAFLRLIDAAVQSMSHRGTLTNSVDTSRQVELLGQHDFE